MPAGSASSSRTTPQVTSTQIPDLQLSGAHVPYLLQKPIPSRYDELSRKVNSRMKDVYFTGCPADQVNYVDPSLRINMSAVYTQFDTDLGSNRHLADQTSYSSGVLRIVAVGATDTVGRTVNTNVAPQLLSTLSVEDSVPHILLFRNDSYLCDSLYPVVPDPNGTVVNNVVIQLVAVSMAPARSRSVSASRSTTRTILEPSGLASVSATRPAAPRHCLHRSVRQPLRRRQVVLGSHLLVPVALTIGYFVVLSLARVFCAWTSRARAFKNKAREGSQPNVIKDTIAPTLVSAISGQKLALSAALLRFATPGMLGHYSSYPFVAAISMVAVRWPEFSYGFFKQAAWSTLTGNVTIIRPASLDSAFNLLATNATLPSGDAGSQFSNQTSSLYMNAQAPNRFMNLDGARAGMEAYAHAVGLRTRDLFGTCLSIWFFIVAAIVGLSFVAWIIDSFHDTFLRVQKRREDGYSLNAADTPALPRRKRWQKPTMIVRVPRSVAAEDTVSSALDANDCSAPATTRSIFACFTATSCAPSPSSTCPSPSSPPTRWPTPTSSLPLPSASPVSPLRSSPCWRRPTPSSALAARPPPSSMTRSARFLPSARYTNNYSPGSQLFCIVDFARTFVLGVVIGAVRAMAAHKRSSSWYSRSCLFWHAVSGCHGAKGP